MWEMIGKSTSGYVFTLAGGAISWKSSKQTVTTSSTMYAEFVACYETTGQVNWLKKFISGLKVVDDIKRPLKLYCDNNPAVQYAHNNRSCGAAKHIDIKYYVVKDKVRDQMISLEHISTEKDARGSAYKRLTTQRVQRTCSRHGFKEKPKISRQKKAQKLSIYFRTEWCVVAVKSIGD